MHKKETREPLFHIVRREKISMGRAVAIRATAIVSALLVCALIFFLLTGKSPLRFYGAMLDGAFGTTRRIWLLIYKTAVLLLISVAVTPAFRMRFWNIGAEGQALVGGLACAAVMFYLGGKVALPILWILMTLASVGAGMLWALLPALAKARWNTNETLFTLMMNYVATQLVVFFINTWVKSGSGTLPPMADYALPTVGNAWILNIVVIALVTAVMYVYLFYSKHGYEITVVGESENTAKYIGISVPTVIIRTMLVSGALCGLTGLIIVGGTNYSITTTAIGGQGFTAIMVSWLGKFNPLYMVMTAFLLGFLSRGAIQVSTVFKINDSISDIVTAVILFFIIGCEFFINYRIVKRSRAPKEGTK